ncbi:hypothetical protein Q1695_003171 [Nippostrongylus brasiliensis]|nr:hypothetical protein Q1695_003171 [Nippostrongylus brasiliensis]
MSYAAKRLPDSGVYTEEGYLFHHSSCKPVKRDELERLREHDIRYEVGSRFTPEEDEQIKKNWRRFASKNNLPYDKARSYAGVPGCEHVFANQVERLQFNKATAFWPKMCHKLPHRSAGQVRARIGILFDPAILSGKVGVAYSKSIYWSPENTEKLLKLYRIHGMSMSAMKKIGVKLQMPAHSCLNHLNSVLARTGPVPDYLYKKLWVLVTKHMTSGEGKPLENVMEDDIRNLRIEEESQYDSFIPWNVISSKVVYSIEKVKHAWHQLLMSLQKHCEKQRSLGKSPEEALSSAYAEVLFAVPPISCEDFSVFLRVLSEATPSDSLYESFRQKLYDRDALRSQLEEEGVVGFHSGPNDELTYLFRKTIKLMWRTNNLLFRRLRLPYTLKERIRLLSLAYDYQCEFSSPARSSEEKGSGDNYLPERYRFKYLNLKNAGFPALHRAPFVEALVVFSLTHFDDWIPPTTLKKYVVSRDVLNMFPPGKNNTELLHPSDLQVAASLLDLHVAGFTSSEEEPTMPICASSRTCLVASSSSSESSTEENRPLFTRSGARKKKLRLRSAEHAEEYSDAAETSRSSASEEENMMVTADLERSIAAPGSSERHVESDVEVVKVCRLSPSKKPRIQDDITGLLRAYEPRKRKRSGCD